MGPRPAAGPGHDHAAARTTRWDPATRIPALTIAPGLRRPFTVDRASHDTTSIMATIEHRFRLRPVAQRDGHVQDLSTVFGGRR